MVGGAGRLWSQLVVGGAGRVWSLGSEAGRVWSQLVVGGAGCLVGLESFHHCQLTSHSLLQSLSCLLGVFYTLKHAHGGLFIAVMLSRE